MLGRSDCHLLIAALVERSTLGRSESADFGVVHIVAEAPVVFSSYIVLAIESIVAPPHVAQGEKVAHTLGIVRVLII